MVILILGIYEETVRMNIERIMKNVNTTKKLSILQKTWMQVKVSNVCLICSPNCTHLQFLK